MGEVEEGAIKWRRGRSEAPSFAQAVARLPEVKRGRDEGVDVPWLGGGWGACCFSEGLRAPSAPSEGEKSSFSLQR